MNIKRSPFGSLALAAAIAGTMAVGPGWSTKGATAAPTRETKAFQIEFKDIGEDGTFSGYANTFNFVDHHKDLTVPGAFKRTLDAWRGKSKPIPILYQHNPNIVIGYIDPADAAEDSKGLAIKGKLILDTNEAGQYMIPEAAKVYALMKAKVLDSMSIGYDTIQDKWEKGVRHLKELKLYEVSIVLWPANDQSTVTAVKGLKAADFTTTLQQAADRQAMYDLRWKIEDALSSSNWEAMQTEGATDAEKLAQVQANFFAYAQAMTGWFEQAMGMGLFQKAGDGPDEAKAFNPDAFQVFELKAGRTHSSATIGKLQTAFDAVSAGMSEIQALLEAAKPEGDPADSDSPEGKNGPEPASQGDESNDLHSIAQTAQAIGFSAWLKSITPTSQNG